MVVTDSVRGLNVAWHLALIGATSPSIAAGGPGDLTAPPGPDLLRSPAEALYPAAVFPPITSVVGRISTGGTVTGSGIGVRDGAAFLAASGYDGGH